MWRRRDYPSEIIVGEAVWDVRFVKKIDTSQSAVTYGLCDPGEQTIYIRLGQSPEERLKTFVHEVLHAFEYEYGFEMPHALVHKLEGPIAAFLMDNVLD